MAFSKAFNNLLNDALTFLEKNLTVTTKEVPSGTHRLVEVNGWRDDEAISALAIYLVALRASVIDQAGRICSDLIDSPRDFANDLVRSVDEIVIQPTDSDEPASEWKSKWRNPWIAEGLWHCCMRLAMERADIHQHGTVIAVDLPHVSPKDHGLDVTALYVNSDGDLGLSFVETKAYRKQPNKAIIDALKMLKSIEAGEYDTRLRQMITSLRSVIDEPYKQQLTSSLWKDERTHIPNPHYEINGSTVRWHTRRRKFLELSAPVVIMPHGINGFRAFFEDVANEMRQKAQEVAAYV